MSEGMTGLAVLVTGGGSGIGRAAVDAYVAAGAVVTVLDRSPGHLARLRSDHGQAVTALHGDATAAADLDAAVAEATRSTGGALGNLTCCVGVFDGYASIRDLDGGLLRAAAEEIWRLNVLSTFLAVNRAIPALQTGGGSVTLTLSGSAYRPEGGGFLYGSSKWALRGAVEHLAKDLAPEIRVNGVAPGGTAGTALSRASTLTDVAPAPGGDAERSARIRASTALDVLPEPRDHAAAFVYLADPVASRIVTGAVINTDGGRP